MRERVPKRYLGTYHKTGTALFRSILKKAATHRAIATWLMNSEPEPAHWDIAFDPHTKSMIADFDHNPETSRHVVCIRDPRDIVVSAAYYHCRSDEEWLHKPVEAFGGLTYQQKINSLPDMQDRFRFEMEHSAKWQINQMLRLPFGADSLLVTRLETLVVDHDLWEFHKIFSFLRFGPEVVPGLLRFAYESSLFSGKIKSSMHARNGAAAQYKTEFAPETMELYRSLFPDAAARLAYDD